VRNGSITTLIRLACAIHVFAGGSPYDIMGKYGSLVWKSWKVFYVVEAVNTVGGFVVRYLELTNEQEKIAKEFQWVSTANIDICASVIDRILIWMAKPSSKQAAGA
jgi:hypothetical protein